MVFGTFDYLHPGHLNFFKQARALVKNPHLIVSVSRDKNAKRVKGVAPENTEKDRIELVSSIRIVDEVVLGSTDNYLLHIKKAEPDIIALGYDQSAYTEHLAEKLMGLGVNVSVVRLKPHRDRIFKTSKIKKSLERD